MKNISKTLSLVWVRFYLCATHCTHRITSAFGKWVRSFCFFVGFYHSFLTGVEFFILLLFFCPFSVSGSNSTDVRGSALMVARQSSKQSGGVRRFISKVMTSSHAGKWWRRQINGGKVKQVQPNEQVGSPPTADGEHVVNINITSMNVNLQVLRGPHTDQKPLWCFCPALNNLKSVLVACFSLRHKVAVLCYKPTEGTR